MKLSQENQTTWDELKDFLERNEKRLSESANKEAYRKFERWLSLLNEIEGMDSIELFPEEADTIQVVL